MAAPDAHADWAVIACATLLLLAYGLIAGPSAARAVVSCWRALRNALGRSPEKLHEKQTYSKLFEKVMENRRIDNVEFMIPFANALWATNCLASIVKILLDRPRHFATPQDIFCLAGFAITLFCGRCLRWFPVATSTCLYIATTIVFLFLVALADDQEEALFLQASTGFPRLLVSLAYARGGPVTFMSTLHSVAASFAFSQQVWSRGLGTFVQNEIWLSAFLITMTWGWKIFMERQVRQEINTAAMQSEVKASRRLLNTICDATVELDGDLCIVDDAKQLAGTLQHGYNRSLQGVNIEQFVVENDRELFRERIVAAVPENQAMANLFHVHMRDSLSNTLSVEVFHVPVAHSLTASRHLVGIREHSDARVAGRAWAGREPASAPACPPGLPGPVALPGRPTSAAHEQLLSMTFDASSFVVRASSGRLAEVCQPGCCLKRRLRRRQDFCRDLEMGLCALDDKLLSEPLASYSFRSAIALDCGSSVVELLCSVELSREAGAARPDGTQLVAEAPATIATIQALKSRVRSKSQASESSRSSSLERVSELRSDPRPLSPEGNALHC